MSAPRNNNARPSAETLEKARIVKKVIEKKYTSLYEEEKTRKEYIDNLIYAMKSIEATKEEKEEAQIELKKKEVEVWRNRRHKMKISDFTAEAIIGKGAFGEVRLCKEKSPPYRLVAIKKMKKDEMIKKNQSKHVIAEREILAQADNKWIVDLHSSFTDSENLYLVMEYLPGGDLMNQLIKRDIFSEEETRFYMVELVLSIESVHALNYIHRDIKPDNILLDNTGHIKLSDFGLCKYYESEFFMSEVLENHRKQAAALSSGQFIDLKGSDHQHSKKSHHRNRKKVYSMVGTIDYIAPEVFGKKGYTESVDWWSLGTIMFEMMVGYPPFVASDAAKTCHKIIQWQDHFDIPEDIQLSPNSEDLIRKLIDRADTRLGSNGADEIKQHPFFEGVDWDSYASKTKAPHRPNLKSDTDVSNFDSFEDDGSWVPAKSTKTVKKNGQQSDYESLFIGYSFKKKVDPDMNKHVEDIVNQIRAKKQEQMKRNASQEQVNSRNHMFSKTEANGFRKKKPEYEKNRFKKKVKGEGKGNDLEVIRAMDKAVFKTMDVSSKDSRGLYKRYATKETGKSSTKGVLKRGMEEKVQKQLGPKKKVVMLWGKKNQGLGSFKKTMTNSGIAKGNTFSKQKSPSIKKPRFIKTNVMKKLSKSKKEMESGQKQSLSSRDPKKSLQGGKSKFIEIKRDPIYNVYSRKGKVREGSNSANKKKLGNTLSNNMGAKDRKKPMVTGRDKIVNKIYSVEKSSGMRKIKQNEKGLKKLPGKESEKSRLTSNRKEEQERKSKKSMGKLRLLSDKGIRQSGIGRAFGKSKPQKASKLYYSNAKLKPGSTSSRFVDQKDSMQVKNGKMFNSQIKGTSNSMMQGTKQYRSNIYDP